MKLDLFYHLINKRKLIFITTASAYKAITGKEKDNFSDSLKIIIGPFSQTGKNTKDALYVLPLTSLKPIPFGLGSKCLVVYSDIVQLTLGILFLLLNKDNIVIFTCVLNSRALYILDKIKRSKVLVIDWQSEYIYKYMNKRYNTREFYRFKYGKFVFRRSHLLKCQQIFAESSNRDLYSRINFKRNGHILIIENPNREITYWKKIIDIINLEMKISNTKVIILIHPKTNSRERKNLTLFLEKYLCNHELDIKTTEELLLSTNNQITISKCITIGSTMDFLFFEKNIPVLMPNINYNVSR